LQYWSFATKKTPQNKQTKYLKHSQTLEIILVPRTALSVTLEKGACTCAANASKVKAISPAATMLVPSSLTMQ